MDTNDKNLKTLSYAYPIDLMKELSDALKGAGYRVEETGSAKDPEGHVIEAFMDDAPQPEQGPLPVMWAMIHSNQQTYLLRADPRVIKPTDAPGITVDGD